MATTKATELGQLGGKLTVHNENITLDGNVHGQYAGFDSDFTNALSSSVVEGLGIDVPATNLTGTIPAARLSTATTQAESDDSTKIATTAYVVDKITTLIGGAPSTLNDLNELAAAINDDANYNSTLTTALATKLPLAGGTLTGNLSFGDNDKAIFGAGSDLQIYSDGNYSYLRESNGTSGLKITSDNQVSIRKHDDENIAVFNIDGAVRFYHDNAQKFTTTSTGIDVTGTVTSDGLIIGGDGVVKGERGTASAPAYSFTDDADTGMFNISNANLGFSVSGTERMRIQSDGAVVIKPNGITTGLRLQGRSSDNNFYIQFKSNNGNSTHSAIGTESATNGLLYNSDIHRFNSTSSATEYMRIDSSGKVGIGTASPSAVFHVNRSTFSSNERTMKINNGGNNGGAQYDTLIINQPDVPSVRLVETATNQELTLSVGNENSNSAVIGSTGQLVFAIGRSASTLAYSAGGRAMTINSTGNVGIGTASPTVKLQVEGDQTSNPVARIKGTGVSDNPVLSIETNNNSRDPHLRLVRPNGTSGASMVIRGGSGSDWLSIHHLSRGADDQLVIRSNGNVGIGTNSPTEKLHVAGVIRSEGYDTDSITSYNITGSYTAGTEYVFTTRSQINGLGYGAGFYKFLVWSDTFHAGTSHYQCYTPYDEFYHNNYGSNTSTVQTIDYGVSMGHAPNTGTRAIDIRLRHKYGADATYPANQTFTFIPVSGFTNLNGNVGYHLRIYLFKVA